MAIIKPFKGVRPPKEFVEEVASRPYDVLSSEEAAEEAANNEKSLYRIIKPEIEFEDINDEYNMRVYERAAENFQKFQDEGWLVQDEENCYYVYAQTMNKRAQYGIVVCTHADDYKNGIIKKHELTRRDKEDDRMKHVRANNANIEPVFYTYRDVSEIDTIVKKATHNTPEYSYTANDGIEHEFWVIKDRNIIEQITEAFATIPHLYVADGHHRSAAAVRVAQEKAEQNPNHTGNEEYNFFMSVCFPASQLFIMDYNRVIKDLNNLTEEEILSQLKENFLVEEKGHQIVRPAKAKEFSLYMGGRCYYLRARAHISNEKDIVKMLDANISSTYILDRIFDIKDLRTDTRIDFVGGIRGLDALKEMVDNGEAKVALALYPVTMKEIMDIADLGEIMPPKTTWFEPKLRSGLVIHKLD